jgi:hypothetical protein
VPLGRGRHLPRLPVAVPDRLDALTDREGVRLVELLPRRVAVEPGRPAAGWC